MEHLFRELRRDSVDAGQPVPRQDAEAYYKLAAKRAELATARAAQAHTKEVLQEIDALDPDHGGWLAWLGQIRRAVLVSKAAGGDLWVRLRTRAVLWSALFAVLGLAGICIAVRYGQELRGWAQSFGWAVAALGAAAAVLAPLRQV